MSARGSAPPQGAGLLAGVSVVIPVFNSAGILPALAERLIKFLDTLGQPYEVILVNDGSRDQSAEVLTDLAKANNRILPLHLMRNFGQHNAILCGVRHARYDVVVTMDDDLQHPPEAISRLLAALRGFDVVYGTPLKEQHGLFRDLASRATKLALQGALGAEMASKVSAYRAFRTEVRGAFDQYDGPFVSIDVLLSWGTTNFNAIGVEHQPRRQGVTNYTIRKLVTHALNMMTGFSVLPLQFASVVGFGFTLFGMAVFLFVLIRYLIAGSVVAGFPFLASIISIFAGGQLLALGIIGEYLARMHFRLMAKPSYVIRRSVSRELTSK